MPGLKAFSDLLVRARQRERPDPMERHRARERARRASALAEPAVRLRRSLAIACQAALRCEPPPPLTWLRGTAIKTSPPRRLPPRFPPRFEREALPPRCERVLLDFAPVLRRERVLDDVFPRRPVERFCDRLVDWPRLPERAPLRAVLLRAELFVPVLRDPLLVPRELVVRRPRADELRVDADPRLDEERRLEVDPRFEPVRLVERALVRPPVVRRPDDDDVRVLPPREPAFPRPVLPLRERELVLRDEVLRGEVLREPD